MAMVSLVLWPAIYQRVRLFLPLNPFRSGKPFPFTKHQLCRCHCTLAADFLCFFFGGLLVDGSLVGSAYALDSMMKRCSRKLSRSS